jgi:hypothetical protein
LPLSVIAASPVRGLPEQALRAQVRRPAALPGLQALPQAALPVRSRWPAGSPVQQASSLSTSLRQALSQVPDPTAASRSQPVQ